MRSSLVLALAFLLPGVALGQVVAPGLRTGIEAGQARDAAAAIAGGTAAMAAGGLVSRTHAARFSDVLNVRDFGARGDNSSTAIGTTYGTTLASMAAYTAPGGGHPLSWMTNPLFGLTFSMTTSAAQGSAGTALTFLSSLAGINGWAATVAQYDDPNHGNYLLASGMLVTSGHSCIPAGATVSSVNYTAGSAGYGQVTLSARTRSACPSGTVVTFTIAPSQLQARTQDWLGIQNAMAAAWSRSRGGKVVIPGGTYNVNGSMMYANNVTDTGLLAPMITVEGDGIAQSLINITTELGQNACAFGNATRGSGSTGRSLYRGFRLQGPSFTVTLGTAPARMDGICIGSGDEVDSVKSGGFHAGVNGIEDHWKVRNSDMSYNGYGIYWGKYSTVMGNQLIENTGLVSDTIAGVGVGPVNQIDQSQFTNNHMGFGPYGFVLENVASNVTSRGISGLSNSVLIDNWLESFGNGWIVDFSRTSAVGGNTFSGGGFPLINNGYKISATPQTALIDVASFSNNTMVGTQWGNYGWSDSIIKTAGDCATNVFYNDTTFVNSGGGTVPPFNCAAYTKQNSFYNADVSGKFVINSGGGDIPKGFPVTCAAGYGSYGYINGGGFCGVAVVVGKPGKSYPLAERGVGLTLAMNGTPAVGYGNLLYPTSSGFEVGLDQAGAVGIVEYATGAATSTVYADILPTMSAGHMSFASTTVASGTTQGSNTVKAATMRYTSVASGTAVTLANVPIGYEVVIYNDGANALLVFPQSGYTINSLAANASMSCAAGATCRYRRITSTGWHS